jgi:ribosomal protein S27AE
MSNADWWASKLAQQAPQQPPAQQGRPINMPPMPPSQQPMAPMPSFQPQSNPSERAQSAKQTAACPECGSGNYMAVANAAPRCYDCGYPISQSGSRFGNLTGAHVEGAAKSARGNDTQSNWNPQGIIGRIDG